MPTATQPQNSFARPSGGKAAEAVADWLDSELSLARLELLELAVPQLESFRSAIGMRNERRALFVRWIAFDGGRAGGAPAESWGIGECSCRPDPYFNGEFLAGAKSVIERFVFPALPRRGTVRELVRILGRVRGWSFTTAAVLDAAADLLRRQGIADPFDRWPRPRAERVPVGISLGIFESAEAALERIGREVAEGYRRIKLKIDPSVDRGILERVRAAYPELRLGFDANGSFGAGDLNFLASLAELEPAAIEQPFPPDRLDLCRQLKERQPELRICLDESITGAGLLAAAHQLAALDEVNLKPGRVGGALASLEILDQCRRLELPAWVGGMFETGVGRAQNLRVAACLPEAEAHDLSPSCRYFAVDVLRRPITMDPDGHVAVPSAPVELDEEAVERLTVDRRILST